MVSGGDPHLISVAKYNKYALRGVLGFDAKGGHITYENTYHSGAALQTPKPGNRRRFQLTENTNILAGAHCMNLQIHQFSDQ